MNKTGNKLGFALLLSLPVFLFYAAYLFHHVPGLTPTGFIQYDNVGYAAYAKQYLDADKLHLFYSNPFNDSPDHARIYFQTQNIFLVLLMKAGLTPGAAVCIFSILFCIFAIYLAISLYDLIFPAASYRKLSLLLLIWGGGMVVVASLMALPLRPQPGKDFIDKLFYLDPANGWWGLNFGRPLLIGIESYYHFLFYGAVLFAFKKRWLIVAILSFVLSFSHPFTGIHLFLVMIPWAFLERFALKDKTVPSWFIIVMCGFGVLHLYYYLLYLPSFPDHKSVADQYALNWNYHFYHFAPAYILVFLLFIGSLLKQGIRNFIQNPFNRFFLCLAVISFLLSNHELFMEPMQPIHFARGYEWTAYFFMGVPFLHSIFKKIHPNKILLGGVILLFLADNFLWLFNWCSGKTIASSITHINEEERTILKIINDHSDEKTLVVGGDVLIPYLSSVYSKAYPWHSHPYTTSFSRQKRESYLSFVQNGKIDPLWNGRNVIFIFNSKLPGEFERSEQLDFPHRILYQGGNYKLIEGYPGPLSPEGGT